MKIRLFAHSWISDWNHGNAHFLRGLADELMRLGHDVRCYEEADSWSVMNLLQEDRDRGQAAIAQFWRTFPSLDVRFYRHDHRFEQFAAEELRDADLVVIHEWNSPHVVDTLLRLKKRLGFLTLFHDTHHRAYTSPQEISRVDLRAFDGILAFGEALRRIYREAFRVPRVWTFHEAADTARFSPSPRERHTDVVWVGNWGDEERTRELQEFLLQPAAAMRDRRIAVHGVRYPGDAQSRLQASGIDYRGYLPNLSAPEIYAGSRLTLHVPRRFYSNGLSGIPTIRVFEALACGIPLVCSPWSDTEHLFRPGQDYICVPDGEAMQAEIARLLRDDEARRQLAASGLQTIRQRHTCAHRAQQLMEICGDLSR